MLLVFGLAHGDGSWTQTRLLLTGVIVAAGCGAAVALILSIAPEDQLRGMLFWLMGDLAHAAARGRRWRCWRWDLLVMLPFARELNLLARGDTDGPRARRLGRRGLRGIYVLASLLTAVAVTTAGSSASSASSCRTWCDDLAGLGNDQRLLLPAAALAGGSLLVLADTLARTVIAPQQLPVGVLTALLGVPVFLFLLTRSPRSV
jgi:iron complex transport system permease protein